MKHHKNGYLFKIENRRAAHSLPSISVGRPLTSAVPRNSTLKSLGGRGWDVPWSSSLWLPSNRKPIEVDSLICQNVSPAEMAPISSYTRRKKSAVCRTLSTAAGSRPFPESSHTGSKIAEATKELLNWFFHLREHVIPVDQRCPTEPSPAAILACGPDFDRAFGAEARGILWRSVLLGSLKPVGWSPRCSHASPGNSVRTHPLETASWQLLFSNLEPPMGGILVGVTWAGDFQSPAHRPVRSALAFPLASRPPTTSICEREIF